VCTNHIPVITRSDEPDRLSRSPDDRVIIVDGIRRDT